jgi:hypothetical protein
MAEKKTAVAPPLLWLWNGIGFRLCGRRDYDPRTDSFVCIHCFCLCYVPLFALGAYRVSEAGEGWHFLGRVPLALAAKAGNLLMISGMITLVVCGFLHAPSRPVTPIPSSPGELGIASAPSTEPSRNDNPLSIGEVEAQTLEAEARDSLTTLMTELLAAEFDLDLLAAHGHPFELLGRAYDDEASQQQFVTRLRDHQLYAKTVARYERLLRSRTRRLEAAQILYILHILARDQGALERLADHLTRSGFTVPMPPGLRELYQGQQDEEKKRQLHVDGEGLASLLPQARMSPKRKTVAVVLNGLAGRKMQVYLYGETVNPDEILAWAEEAVQIAPSVATREMLLDAVLLRLHLRLMERQEYAAFAAPLRRSLAPRHILAMALTRLPALAAAIHNDPDLQRAVTLLKDHARRFPRSLSPSGWALLRSVDPASAATWAQELQKDSLGRTDRQARLMLDPWSTSGIMNTYWGLVLEGKEAEATALLRRYSEQGVTLPP